MQGFVLLLEEVGDCGEPNDANVDAFAANMERFACPPAVAFVLVAAVDPSDVSAALAFGWWEPGGALLLRWLCAPPGDFHCRSRGGGLDRSGRMGVGRAFDVEGSEIGCRFTRSFDLSGVDLAEGLAANHADSSSKLNPISIGLDNRATISGRYVSSHSMRMACLC